MDFKVPTLAFQLPGHAANVLCYHNLYLYKKEIVKVSQVMISAKEKSRKSF